MVNECRFPNLFSPGQIGSLVLKNRIIMSAIGTNYRTDLGQISDQHLAFYRERAKGGVAMIIVDSTCVDRRACLFNMPFLDQDQWIPGHARLATTVHEHGAKICAKLFHIGAHGIRVMTDTGDVAGHTGDII